MPDRYQSFTVEIGAEWRQCGSDWASSKSETRNLNFETMVDKKYDISNLMNS